MFYDCSGLTELDVSGFNTEYAEDMTLMFYNCFGLKTLDVSSFKTHWVSSMRNMFHGCSNLISLDLSGFEISNETIINSMFYDCVSLRTIILGENINTLSKDTALINGYGWVNSENITNIVSGDGENAVIENDGRNTYKRLTEAAPTSPTNINVTYSEKYHQVRFSWDKVYKAESYGIAVYLAGKWKVQTQNITDTVYTTPKNLTPGMTYKVAVAAKVNGKWDTSNAIKNAVEITVK